jgi:hypothetical protein
MKPLSTCPCEPRRLPEDAHPQLRHQGAASKYISLLLTLLGSAAQGVLSPDLCFQSRIEALLWRVGRQRAAKIRAAGSSEELLGGGLVVFFDQPVAGCPLR